MTDIVERLRERAEQEHEMLGDIHLPLLEAAAEIEKLRAALREIKKKLLVQSCTCSFVVDDIITRTEGGR